MQQQQHSAVTLCLVNLLDARGLDLTFPWLHLLQLNLL
jgi:hypothetical protein